MKISGLGNLKMLIEEYYPIILRKMEVEPDLSIMVASTYGFLKIVRYLLNSRSINFKTYDPVSQASRHGHLEILKLLLERGASLEDSSALGGCCSQGYLEVVRFITARTRNIKSLNLGLAYACRGGRNEVVKHFLNLGLDPNCGRNTPLTKAIDGGHLSTVQLLVSRGANYRFEDYHILSMAILSGNVEIVEYFLDLGFSKDLLRKAYRMANPELLSGEVLTDLYRNESRESVKEFFQRFREESHIANLILDRLE